MIKRRNFKGPLQSELFHAPQKLHVTEIKQNKILQITEIISEVQE